MHICNASAKEAETGGLTVRSQPVLHSEARQEEIIVNQRKESSLSARNQSLSPVDNLEFQYESGEVSG